MAKCGNIPMNASTIMNAVTMQRRGYYSKFPMKLPLITIVSPRNAVSVALLIAQGWRAKAKSTLGYLP